MSSRVFDIFGCSIFFVMRDEREMRAALNSGDFVMFWTALLFFCSACLMRERRYSFSPDSVCVSRSSRAWEILIACAVTDIPIIAGPYPCEACLARLFWSFKRVILFAGP